MKSRWAVPALPTLEAAVGSAHLHSIFRLENVTNDFAGAGGDGPAEAVANLGIGMDAEAVQDGGGEVLRLDATVDRMGADGVGGAVDDAAADAAAGQGHGEDRAPVVAAAPSIEPRR